MKSSRRWILIILGLIIMAATPALKAADTEPGVARVSLINGEVTSMRADSGDWVALTVNAPLVRGDRIVTGDSSRTEIQLDHANTLRLADRTEARIADLSRSHVQVELSAGLINLTVFRGNEADVEINTPTLAVRPLEEGVYRVQVNPQGETEVIIRKGRAEVFTPQGSVLARKNDLILVRGADDPHRVMNAPGRDSWDRWNEDRDNTVYSARSWGYANRYYTGIHDLDRHGRWVNVPGYDWVWTPYAVGSAWAPYRHGRWVFQPYWGWTWVSYEPWGWAPYHYGRWFHHGSAWYWWPGPVHVRYRPVWAPAYVAFLGFGSGRFNFSFGVGYGYSSIGWLPIGPWDHYYPWHGRHRSSYRAVNVTNITNITNVTNITSVHSVAPLAGRGRPHRSNLGEVLQNPRLRNSITAVSTDDFVAGRVTNRARRIEEHELRQGQLVAGNPPAVPTRESLRHSDRSANPARIANRTEQPERMFARRQAPAVTETFDQGAETVRQMVRRSDPSAGGRSVERGYSAREGAVSRGNAAERGNSMVQAPEESPATPAGRTGRSGRAVERPGAAAGSDSDNNTGNRQNFRRSEETNETPRRAVPRNQDRTPENRQERSSPFVRVPRSESGSESGGSPVQRFQRPETSGQEAAPRARPSTAPRSAPATVERPSERQDSGAVNRFRSGGFVRAPRSEAPAERPAGSLGSRPETSGWSRSAPASRNEGGDATPAIRNFRSGRASQAPSGQQPAYSAPAREPARSFQAPERQARPSGSANPGGYATPRNSDSPARNDAPRYQSQPRSERPSAERATPRSSEGRTARPRR